MTAEEILFDIMTENNFTYVSFPSFVENESSVDVYDIACKAVEYAMEQYRKEGLMDFMNFLENKLIDIVCDNDEQGKEYLIKEYLKQKP